MTGRLRKVLLGGVVACVAVAACGGEADTAVSTSPHPGWDALVALHGRVPGDLVDDAAFRNLATLVGEHQTAECLQRAGFGYQLLPLPEPDPAIEEYLEDWSSLDIDLASSFATRNPGETGLGLAYRSYALTTGTEWTRDWIRAQTELNDELFVTTDAGEAESRCYASEPPAEAWLWTKDMDRVQTAYSDLMNYLREEIRVGECGDWTSLDREFHDPGGAPTAEHAAGDRWTSLVDAEFEAAESSAGCVVEKLDVGDQRIAEAVRNFERQHGDRIDSAAADWADTERILTALVANEIDFGDPVLDVRRSWTPDWAPTVAEDVS